MIDKSVFKALKQTTLSVDAELSKSRVNAILKEATAAQKQEMAGLVDAAVSTIKAMGRTGKVSAKTALPMAIVMDLDPAYLTGETDERGSASDEAINGFLRKHGYENLIEQPAEKKTRGRKPKVEKAEKAEKPARGGRRKKFVVVEPVEIENVELVDEIVILDEIAEEPQDEPQAEEIADAAEDEFEQEAVTSSLKDAFKEALLEVFEGAVDETEPEDAELLGLLALAEDKIASFDPEKLEALDALTGADIDILFRSLEIKATTSESSKTLARLVRLLLI